MLEEEYDPLLFTCHKFDILIGFRYVSAILKVTPYVDKEITYKDHVEAILNVVFTILSDYETYKIRSSVDKATFIKMYEHI